MQIFPMLLSCVHADIMKAHEDVVLFVCSVYLINKDVHAGVQQVKQHLTAQSHHRSASAADSTRCTRSLSASALQPVQPCKSVAFIDLAERRRDAYKGDAVPTKF